MTQERLNEILTILDDLNISLQDLCSLSDTELTELLTRIKADCRG